MDYLKYGVGIDMAMKKFDVCLSLIDNVQKVTVKSSTSFTNNLKGFNDFSPSSRWVLSEAVTRCGQNNSVFRLKRLLTFRLPFVL